MGSSSSSLSFPDPPKAQPFPDKKPNTVYFKGKVLKESKLPKRKEQVMEFIVCKMATIGHWFIKINLDITTEGGPLELHYVSNSSIQAFYRETNKPQLQVRKETRYAPENNIKLAHILQECLEFVGSKSYSFTSYNCQDFVTTIMSKFTNRRTSSVLSIPVISHTSSFRPRKKRIMSLEKEFFLRCQGKGGVELGLKLLKETNQNIKKNIEDIALGDHESGPVMERFVESVMKPEEENYNNSKYEEFLERQGPEICQRIRDQMLQSWRLASFLIFLEKEKWERKTDLLAPAKAYEEYQCIM